METYWTYEVVCIEGEKKRSLVIAPCDSLAQAMAGAFKDATYYIGVCGYKVALVFHNVQGVQRLRGDRPAYPADLHRADVQKCKGHPIIRDSRTRGARRTGETQ